MNKGGGYEDGREINSHIKSGKTEGKITELFRVYTFPNKENIRIDKCRELKVSDSGNHRIITEDGHLHIVPKGWLHIEIESEVGEWEL